MKERIEAVVGALLGSPLVTINRAASMAMFGFGRMLDGTDLRGNPRRRPEFSLHVDGGTWRIIGQTGSVVLGRADTYHPRDDPDEEPDGFEWDRSGANRFDEIADQLRARVLPLEVVGVAASEAGDLTLRLAAGFRLEVLIDSSLRWELWRFFGATGHFVVSAAGILEDAGALSVGDRT